MRRARLISILVVVVFAGWGAEAAGQYSGGTGEPNRPYEIANVDDLPALAGNTGDYGAYFILTADITRFLTGIVYDRIKQAFCG